MASITRIKSPARQFFATQAKTAAYTILPSESGTLFKFNSATSFNFTLPAVNRSMKGLFYDFQIQTAATSGTGHGFSPAAADKIFGATATAVDDKDVYWAEGGDAIGNSCRLTCDGVDGWHVTALNGTLSQEA